MWLLLLACATAPEDSSGAPDPSVARIDCTAADPVDAPEPAVSDAGTNVRVVPLTTAAGEAADVLISWSPHATRAWKEGAPVVIAAQPAHKVDRTWNLHPGMYYGPDVGVVELQPVWPGWTVMSVTSGTFDAGGEGSQAVLDAVLAFAAGGLDADGHTLEQYVNVPVCHGAVALLSLSSGGMPTMAGLASFGSTYADSLVGLTLYEPPSLPEFVIEEAGAIWMDPDPKTDANGDGYAWNDGRNSALDEDSCAATGCVVDYTHLVWSNDHRLSDLWVGYDATLPQGLYFFDGNGSGALDLDAAGLTDVDGDGAIQADEDLWCRPLALGAGESLKLYYSPGLTRAAEALGAARWPPFVASSPEADTFWAARSMVPWADDVAKALPDAQFSLVYSSIPHGPPLLTQPGERLLHDAFVNAGVRTHYNFTVDAARCFGGTAFDDYPGPPPDDAVVAPEEMEEWGVLESTGAVNIQAVGPLDQLQQAFRPFDHCPEASASE